MRTFLLTLSEESDPRNHRHQILAGPTSDYMKLRADFHAKNSDAEFSILSLWDSTGGVIRRKRLLKEIAKPTSSRKSKSEAVLA
jgi:hypothetical protein